MMPFRLEVLNRLTAIIESANGDDHLGNPIDITGRVYRGRIEFGDDTTLPAVSILEAPAPDIGRFAGATQAIAEKWTLLIQGWALDDKANPSDAAYYLAAAVQQQLARIIDLDQAGRAVDKDAYLLGKLITDFEIGPHVVRPFDTKTSSRAFFYLPVRVGLARNVNQPYLSV